MGAKFKLCNLALLVTLNICSVLADFRFCHWGPQRFKNSDCPYGIMLRSPISTSCIYYANDGTGMAADAEVISSCTKTQTLAAAGEQGQGLDKIHNVFLDVSDPSDKGTAGTIANQCTDECLGQWVPYEDRSVSSGGEPPEESDEYMDFVAPEQPDVGYNKNLTAQLFISLIEDKTPMPIMNYLRSAQLLKLSFEIMRTLCSPFIPAEFTEQLYRGFLFLVLKSVERVNDLGVFEFDTLMGQLKDCKGRANKKAEKGVEVYGINCNNYTRITGYGRVGESEANQMKYKIKQKSYRWNKYDPFIEGTWSAIDFVHGYCFDKQRSDFNFHHVYEAGMEPLFTKTILARWPYAPKLVRGDTFWNNILNAKDAKMMMQNMDACAQSGYLLSPYKQRLNRPFVKFYNDIGGSPSGDVQQSRAGGGGSGGGPKGWDASKGDYWTSYDTDMGFSKYLTAVGGKCLKTENDFNEARLQNDEACNSAGGE